MEAANVNPIEMMADIIQERTPHSIWTESPLEGYRRLGNTNRGQIGEDFLERYLAASGVDVRRDARTNPIDMYIEGHEFEVKTASLGANGTFQFNHIRLDRMYQYLLCLGICPDSVVFQVWRKGVVSEGEAGTLVRMAEGQSTTHKLTKRLSDMRPIGELIPWVQQQLG